MIKSYFEKENSWVKHEGRNNHTLEHEQIHFDITELYARKLRKELSQRSFDCGQEADFVNFVNTFLEGWQQMQVQYDIESGYSNNHIEQEQWIFQVRKELKELEEFGSK